MITDEEKDMVLESIKLALVLEVLERDKEAIKQSSIKIKEPYLKYLEAVIDDVLKATRVLNNKMRKQQIKIFKNTPINEDFVEYRYVVRGYESNMRMFRYALRNYTRDKLKEFFHVPK